MIIIGAGEKIKDNVYLLGSNSEKILKKSNKPVFVVKNGKQFGIKKILCPVDFSEESINEFNTCLSISVMHLPSLKALTKVYNKLGDTTNENKFKKMTTQVLDKMYNEKIETEIRKNKSN